MRFEGVNLRVERNWPLAERVHLGAYSRTLHRFVTSTDTVRICGYRNNPPLFGRIIKTSDDIESVRASGVPLHPDLEILLLNPSPDSRENPPVLLKMQWIILKTQSLALDERAAWTIHDFDTLLATGDLPEAAHTNCTVWVAVDQVCAFVPVPHKDDCVNHTYGATDGRGDTLFTCAKATFDIRGNHTIQYLAAANYDAFGPGTKRTTPTSVN